MSDLLAIAPGLTDDDPRISESIQAINLHGQYRLEKSKVDDWLLAVTCRSDAPVGGPRTFQGERWTLVFSGDVVDHDAAPFADILTALDSGRWEALAGLNGIFAVVAYDKVDCRLCVITDRRGQKPLFYRSDLRGLQVSTNLAALVRLADSPELDRTWLWESLYFNFPVTDGTLLADVKRLPPASVLAYDDRTRSVSIFTYAERFAPRKPLLGGKEALQHATEVFASRTPAYFQGASSVACALTGGWDARTMLALAPAGKELTAYTYGSPGCIDLLGATATAKALGVDHVQIPFDRSFVDDLPRHALETVYLSGGLQGVLRSTLHYAYGSLTDSGNRYPLIISGIALDMQFRGHANCPNLVSPDIERCFRGQRCDPFGDDWREIIGPGYDDFVTHICGRSTGLQESFGPFESTAHHLAYLVYPVSTHHFCGELAISDHLTTVRVPCWDSALIELAFSIEQSTLTFSQFLKGNTRGARAERLLQAHLFKRLAPAYYRLPVRNSQPAMVLAGEVPYRLDKFWRATTNRIRSPGMSARAPGLENWDEWLFDKNRPFIDDLLESASTLVGNYVNPAFIRRAVALRNQRMVGKLLTTEIVLRLLRTGWQRFW